MARVIFRRIQGGVIGPVAPWADLGAAEVVVERHGYLRCLCGDRLWIGQTEAGAPVLLCSACQRFVDGRRVA